MKKARKPRGWKLTGIRSEDMCKGCLSFDCDPFTDGFRWRKKKEKRLDAGLCPSCGHNPCACKSTLDLPYRKKTKELTSLKNAKSLDKGDLL